MAQLQQHSNSNIAWTPTVNITAAQNCMPNFTVPSLKLLIPVFDSGDWGNPAVMSIFTSGGGGLLSAGPVGLDSGMYLGFMLKSLDMSPGVSGSEGPNWKGHCIEVRVNIHWLGHLNDKTTWVKRIDKNYHKHHNYGNYPNYHNQHYGYSLLLYPFISFYRSFSWYNSLDR